MHIILHTCQDSDSEHCIRPHCEQQQVTSRYIYIFVCNIITPCWHDTKFSARTQTPNLVVVSSSLATVSCLNFDLKQINVHQ